MKRIIESIKRAFAKQPDFPLQRLRLQLGIEYKPPKDMWSKARIDGEPS